MRAHSRPKGIFCLKAILCVIAASAITAHAEYYVVYHAPINFIPYHYGYHHRYHHIIFHHYHHFRYSKHWHSHYYMHINRECYDPDLTTGDDNPCVYPDMDIDE